MAKLAASVSIAQTRLPLLRRPNSERQSALRPPVSATSAKGQELARQSGSRTDICGLMSKRQETLDRSPNADNRLSAKFGSELWSAAHGLGG